MVVHSNRSLVHPCDHCRAKGRANRRCSVGPREQNAFPRQTIDMRRLDGLLSVAGKVRRHIVDHNPKDIGPVFAQKAIDARQCENTSKGHCYKAYIIKKALSLKGDFHSK